MGMHMCERHASRCRSTPNPFPVRSTGQRTGVSGYGGTHGYPWRFWIASDPIVSPDKAHAPKKRSAN